MTTLTSEPVRGLLDRLFTEATANHQEFLDERAALLARGLRLGSPEFTELTGRAFLAITPETGRLLYLLIRTQRPQTIVEFGTSFGVSTIPLAAGVRDNGTGMVITTELDPGKVSKARENLHEAELDDLVEVLEGDALQTIPARDLPQIDLLFVDGFNHLYLAFLQLVEPQLAPKALIIADNADSPGYRDHLYDDARYVSVTVDGRIEVSLKAG